MDSLFAPWRMEFIEKHDPQKSGCILCTIGKTADGASHHILERGQYCYVVMNKYPYTNGHLMVVPLRHEGSWISLTKQESSEIHDMTQKSLKALTASIDPQGFNLGVNLGRAAGAGIVDHVHQHIVPRWTGDFNFMPLLSETKVISEHLETTYQRLLKAWRQL